MFKWLKCKFRMCGCIPKSDEKACWSECVDCGKKAAYLDRRIIRSYMQLQDAQQAHKELVKRIDLEEPKGGDDAK